MPKSPAYQWYPKDALTSQRLGEMTLEEEGAYRRALDSCWLAGSLPNDPVRLARIIGKGCSEEVARVVLAMFDITSEDGVRVMHDTLERERRKQADWREKSALGGKRSAGKRKHPKTLGDEQGGSDVVDTNSPPNGNIAVSCLQSSSSKEIKHILPSRKPRSKKELTGLPDDFPITDDMRSWFAEKCPNLEIERETEKFKERCVAKGTQYKNWKAGWKTQMLNASEWKKEPAKTITHSIGSAIPQEFDKTQVGGVSYGRSPDLPEVRRAEVAVARD